jgi:hypothetical protein
MNDALASDLGQILADREAAARQDWEAAREAVLAYVTKTWNDSIVTVEEARKAMLND